MKRDVRLLEAYVPRMRAPGSASWDDVQHRISDALAHGGHTCFLIGVPQDEMVLILAWSEGDRDQLPDVSLLSRAIDLSGTGAVVQRVVDAQLLAVASPTRGTHTSGMRQTPYALAPTVAGVTFGQPVVPDDFIEMKRDCQCHAARRRR